jgi:ribosome-binding factor A
MDNPYFKFKSRDFESPRGCLITISRTEPTPDLKHAKVFVSVLPNSMSGTGLAALKKQTGQTKVS